MKNLYKAFLNSLYNPVWLKKQRFAADRAWTYFSLWVFVLSVAVAVPISLSAWPIITNGQKYFSSNVPDFEANFKNGSLQVNRLAQPFVYRINDQFVLVVDTVRTTTAALTDYVTSTSKASLFVTADRMEFNDSESGQSRIQKWANVPDGTVTKGQLESTLKNFLKPWFYFLGVIAVFIGFYVVFFISKLYTILVVALVVSVMAKFTGRNLKLKNLFIIGLYAITLPSIIGMAFTLMGIGISYVEFMAMLAFMLAVVMSEKSKKVVEDE
ncbi:MAG: DUF1189 family protein [Patescibacteria group bacterium]|jgi:hypothetical protein